MTTVVPAFVEGEHGHIPRRAGQRPGQFHHLGSISDDHRFGECANIERRGFSELRP
jgi:hypothetical protein